MASPGKQMGSIKIASGATVCQECELFGDITIGARSVLHPKCRIIAEAGPIIIGEGNLIEELVEIVNKVPVGSSPGNSQTVMIIGNNNVFEVGSYSEALKIGDNNILESKARIGRQTELSNGCIVGAKCILLSHEMLPENTVIYGTNCQRRQQAEKPGAQTLQLDFLSKILPNFHHLIKPNKSSVTSPAGPR